MGKLYPSIEIIEKFIPFTNEEINLIKYLKDNLDENFNIFFKPNLNGDIPKIIILKKDSGVLIIEIESLKLDNYIYSNKDDESKYGHIILKDRKEVCFITPFEKVINYKDNISIYHIEDILKKSILDNEYNKIIKTCVYFYEEKEEDIKYKFRNNYNIMNDVIIWGNDSDIINSINSAFRYNKLFSEDLYEKCFNKFNFKYHKKEKGKFIILEKKKRNLMRSKENTSVKIKGIAGSGKTILLANRAVGALKRTKEKGKILILSYNSTLKNYIEEKINDINEDFCFRNFYITNFNMFINQKTMEYGRNIKKDFNNFINYESYDFFKENVIEEDKYDGIFIDEVQDFKREWLNLLKDIFLKENGEYVLFGDEKQNIYNRALDNKKMVKTNVKGRWNELTKSYRISTNIAKLLREFQKEFFLNKYELDYIHIEEQIGLEINDDKIEYIYKPNISFSEAFDISEEYFYKNNIDYNNTCIVGNNIEYLRDMEYYARKLYNVQVERMFETKEEYSKLYLYIENEEKIDLLRKSRKYNFIVCGSGIKMCQSESFKGWEIDNLVLILDRENNKNNELIYTSIARCKRNLFIINRGNREFDNFYNSIKEKMSCL